MSDLTGKFGALGEQLTDNHDEIMSALDTIATALGAPPPGPTTTLADVVSALTDTNTLLTGIRADMNEKLDFIFNTVDAINNNASLNAQRLISVLLQTACPCDDTVPILPPDLGTTPIDATDIAKCQRIQYFIDLFASWGVNVAANIGNSGSISSFQIDNLLSLTIDDVGITTGELQLPMPTGTRDLIVGQITSAIGASSAGAINGGLFSAVTSSGNLEALRQALYGATTAADGKAAADSAIDGLGLDPLIAGILKSMFYSAWPNDIYGAVPVVDASGYDGTICAPPVDSVLGITECTDFEAQAVIAGEHTYYVIAAGTMGNSNNLYMMGDFGGYSYGQVEGVEGRATMFYYLTTPDGAGTFGRFMAPHSTMEVIPSGLYGIAIVTADVDENAHPFTVRFCPPT